MLTDKQVLDDFRSHPVIFPVNLDLCAHRSGIHRKEARNGYRRVECDGAGHIYLHVDFLLRLTMVGLAAFHQISTRLQRTGPTACSFAYPVDIDVRSTFHRQCRFCEIGLQHRLDDRGFALFDGKLLCMTLIKVLHQKQLVCAAIPFDIAFVRHGAHFLIVDKDFSPRSVAGILDFKITEIRGQFHFFHIGAVRGRELHPPRCLHIIGHLDTIEIRTEFKIPRHAARRIRSGSLHRFTFPLACQRDHRVR